MPPPDLRWLNLTEAGHRVLHSGEVQTPADPANWPPPSAFASGPQAIRLPTERGAAPDARFVLSASIGTCMDATCKGSLQNSCDRHRKEWLSFTELVLRVGIEMTYEQVAARCTQLS